MNVVGQEQSAAVFDRGGQMQAVTELEVVLRPDDRGSLEDRFREREPQQIRVGEKAS